MFPTIGKARFTDFEAFKAWYITEKSKEWARYYWTNHFYNHVDIAAKETGVTDDSRYFCKAFEHLYEPSFRGWWSDATLEHFIKNVEKLNAFIEKNNQQWSVWYLNEEPNYMCIRYGASPENTFIIPDWEKYLSFVSFVYYVNLRNTDVGSSKIPYPIVSYILRILSRGFRKIFVFFSCRIWTHIMQNL